MFTYLLICLLHLFICFIYFVVLGQGSFGTMEKRLWNDLPIVLKKLNETYSDEITNVFLKDARLLNELRHENVVELLTFCDNSVAIIL